MRPCEHPRFHGGYRTPTYQSWRAMFERCTYPDHPFYDNYGGRGITVYWPWWCFACFRDDMGPRPEGTTLDRIDGDSHYQPGNCRWATRTVQWSNRREFRVQVEEIDLWGPPPAASGILAHPGRLWCQYIKCQSTKSERAAALWAARGQIMTPSRA